MCKIEKSIPVFNQAWWMDAVCGEDNWDVFIEEKASKIVGAMTYYMKKKRCIEQPPLTQFNGLWIKYPENQKIYKRLSYENSIIRGILKQLNILKPLHFRQNFNYKFTNWQQFSWNKFIQSTRYTYVLSDTSDTDLLFNNFERDVKSKIKKASKIITVSNDCTIDEFYTIFSMTFERQNQRIPYSFDLIKRLDTAVIQNNAGQMLKAIDENGEVHSAIYIVWDNESVYYIMGGGNPNLRKSGANALLIWNAINIASEKKLRFDFEGSMIESIEKYFRNFNSTQVPFFTIERNWSLVSKLLEGLNRKYKRLRY